MEIIVRMREVDIESRMNVAFFKNVETTKRKASPNKSKFPKPPPRKFKPLKKVC
jgi:hypothetical protein